MTAHKPTGTIPLLLLAGTCILLVLTGFSKPLGGGVQAAELKFGTVDLALVYFFHPRLREYDFINSRFIKFDPVIAKLPPAERLKARRERAVKRAEEMQSGAFKQEIKQLEAGIAEQEKRLKKEKKALEDLIAAYLKRIESETRGHSKDDPVIDEIKTREKKRFEKKRAVLLEAIESLMEEREIMRRAIDEQQFLVAPPDSYTDFMETDRIYWGMRADVRKILEAIAGENNLAVIINSSYLIQDYLPFLPRKETEPGFPESDDYLSVAEEICHGRESLAAVFPFVLDTMVFPVDPGTQVTDYTAEAVARLLTLYGAGDVEISVTKQLIEQRLIEQHLNERT